MHLNVLKFGNSSSPEKDTTLTSAQYRLLMHILNWLRIQNDKSDPLLQSMSKARGVTNIKGSPTTNTDLHIFTTTVALCFNSPNSLQLLEKNPEIKQMVKHFGVSLSFVKGLTASALTDLIKGAKHHSRSGIIVPVYDTGRNCYGHSVFFARTALHFARGVFGGEKKFEVLPSQKEQYEELRSKYQSLMETKPSYTIIKRTFNDPKYCGKYDYAPPPDHYQQRWRHMPNEGKPKVHGPKSMAHDVDDNVSELIARAVQKP